MDILTEDTGRSRTVSVKAKGRIGCGIGAMRSQRWNTTGGIVDFKIGDWSIHLELSPNAMYYETDQECLAIDITGANAVTGETIEAVGGYPRRVVVSPQIVYYIPDDPEWETHWYAREVFNYTFEAELVTTNIHEVFSVEMHNEDEDMPYPSTGKYASWGYPQYGYFTPTENEITSPHSWYSADCWKGGYTSGQEMTIGTYYERYSKDEESASMTTLNLTIACTNPYGSGSETITFGPTAPTEAWEGQKFTGYTYHIESIASNARVAEYKGGSYGYSDYMDPNVIEAEFEANGEWYPYELNFASKIAYKGDYPPATDGEHYGDPDYLIGTITSTGDKITLTPEHGDPDDAYDVRSVGINADINPIGRISVKGKVLQPDGSAWSGSCKLRALWKGLEVNQNTHVGKWQEEDQHIDTDATGELDTNYGCSNITGTILWGGAAANETFLVNQTTLGIYHDQQDLIDKHQFYQAWRIMLQDPWKTEAFSVVHPMVATVDDFSTADLWVGTNASTAWAGGYLTVHATSSGALIHTAYPEAADCGFDSDSDDNPQPEYPQALNYQWKAWRYARVKLKSDTACTLTVKIKYRVKTMPPTVPTPDPPSDGYTHFIKEWDIAVPAGTTYEEYVIDLVAPDRFDGDQSEVDLSDWVADVTEEPGYFRRTQQIKNITSELKHANDNDPDPPIEEDDVMDFVPHQFVGVGHIERLTFSGIPNNATVVFDKLTVNLEDDLTETDSEALLTISPVWQDSEIWKLKEEEDEFWQDKYGYHPEGKRIIGGLANFKSAIDVPYANFGGYKGTGFLTISDAMQWMETDSTVCGLTLSTGYQPAEEDPHHIRGNDHYLAAWLSPILWDVPEKGDVKVFDYKIRSEAITGVDTLTVEARAACDLWYVYPGIGDPLTDYGQTFPLRFVSVLGSLIQGITYKKSTRKPIAGAKVEVWQNSDAIGTLVKAGEFTSNKHHFWRSTILRTDRLYEPNTALAKLVNTALESPWWLFQLCKRQHWASVIGSIINTLGNPSVAHQVHQQTTVAVHQDSTGLIYTYSRDYTQSKTSIPIADTSSYTKPSIAVGHYTHTAFRWITALDGTDLKLKTSGDEGVSWAMSTIATGVSDQQPHIVYDERRQRLSVSFAKSGKTYSCHSHDYGQTWSTPAEIISSEGSVALTHIGEHDFLVGAYLDGDELKFTLTGDRGGSWT